MATVHEFLNPPHCYTSPVVRFGKAKGLVSDLTFSDDNFSFKFGTAGQKVMVLNAKRPDWFVDGIWVELDYDLNMISPCDAPFFGLFEAGKDFFEK